jgi:anti-sigma factor RsiW
MTQLSDELLLAYVDGQLDAPQAGIVSRLMREDYETAARVRRLQETQAHLLQTFGAILRKQGEPMEAAIRLQAPPAGFVWPLSKSLTAKIAAGLLGVMAALAYLNWNGSAPEAEPSAKAASRLPGAELAAGWQAEVGRLHSFFSRDTLAAGPQGQNQASRELVEMQLGKFIRRPTPIPVPDFSKQGLSLHRSQIMNYAGERFLQIVYLGKEEQPVALYVMPGGPDSPMTDGGHNDARTVGWSAGGVRYVMAGFLPQESVKALAVVAQNQIEGRR